MNIYALSHQIQLVIHDLGIEPSPLETHAGLLPDDGWVTRIFKDLEKIHARLQEIKPQVVGTYIQQAGPSFWNTTLNRIEQLTAAVFKIKDQQSITERVDMIFLSGMESKAHECIQSLSSAKECFFQSVRENKKENWGWKVFNSHLASGAQSVSELILLQCEQDAMNKFDLSIKQSQEQLFQRTQTTVPFEFARNITSKIIFSLREKIGEIDTFDLLLRDSDVRSFFHDISVAVPKTTPTGAIVKNLLVNHTPMVEKMIFSNILVGIERLYTKIEILQQKDPLFLVKALHQAIDEATQEIEDAERVLGSRQPKNYGIDIRENCVTGQLQKKIVTFGMKLLYPEGVSSLLVPDSRLIPPSLKSGIWSLLEEYLEKCCKNIFRSVGFGQDFKEQLLFKGLYGLEQFLGGNSSEPTSLVSDIQRIDNPLAPNEVYDRQGDFNQKLEIFLQYFQTSSSSFILRELLRLKGKELIHFMGPKIVQELSRIQLSSLITIFMEESLSRVFCPGGVWQEEGPSRKYVAPSIPSLKTDQEEEARLQRKRLEWEEERQRGAKLRDEFAQSLNGLISFIFQYCKIPELEIPEVDQGNHLQKIGAMLGTSAIQLINKIIYKFIECIIWAFQASAVIRDTVFITEKKFSLLELDTFCMNMSNYSVNAINRVFQSQIV